MGQIDVWNTSNMRETLFRETISRDTSPQMESIVATRVKVLTIVHGKVPHSLVEGGGGNHPSL